jgi:hypothetical protein
MGIKLIKEGKGTKPGKFKGLKFYEYGMYTLEELNELTQNYCKARDEFARQQLLNPKLQGKKFPSIRVSKISDWEIPDLEVKHNNDSEEVAGWIRKNNNNVQIYVKPKGTKKIVTETVMEVIEPSKNELKCPNCDFIAKTKSGLNVHQRRWCAHGK